VTRSVKLLLETLETNLRRFKNFLGFARGFVRRKNPLKDLSKKIVEIAKDMLTVKKKLKMAQYRLNYHRRQLNRMESLIAENNQHIFLKGRKINEVR
jgi:hypothetical protein